MAKSAPIQNAFNAGELSPLAKGRFDLQAKYQNGCEILENYIPQLLGPARKRTGTRYVGAVKNSLHNVEIIGFEHSTTQAYVLEFGDQYIRFYKDGGRVLESPVTITGAATTAPVVVTAPSHGFANGDYVYITGIVGMTEINGRYFTVNNVTTNTFELAYENGLSHTAYVSGGTVSRVYEIATPYLESEVGALNYAHSADVMYLSHPNHPPQKLGRYAHDNWTLTEVVFDWPPFNDENVDDSITITASAVTGSITLTASAALFTTDHVGGYFKIAEVLASKYGLWQGSTAYGAGTYKRYGDNLYYTAAGGTSGGIPPIHTEGTESDGGITDWEFIHDGAGYALVDSFTSDTVVNATVIKRFPQTALTPGSKKWAEGAWSDNSGWPKTVTFYEDRLWFAGSLARPQTLWGSTSGDYENHKYGTNDDDALNYTINSQEVNTIEWLSPSKVMAIGTSGGEFIMSASSSEAAITPTDVRIVPHTTYGSNNQRPLKIGNVVLFMQRAGKKVREFTYTFETDDYVAPNLTILADHILDAGVVDMTYQQEPNQVAWMPTALGTLAGLTYERTEDVVGWHRQVTTNGLFKDSVSIPHWDNDQDVLWVVVERVINGSTVKYIEYFEKYLIDDYAFFVDSGLTYNGAATTSISGLGHLEGQTVWVLADGYVHPERTVVNGSITLQAAASIVTIGLPMIATLKTMPIESGSQNGTAQGKTARINELVMRLYDTGPGLFYGPDVDNMDEYDFRSSSDPMDEPVPLFTGDTVRRPWPDGYTDQAQMTIQHKSPLPCTIGALMPQMNTYDR